MEQKREREREVRRETAGAEAGKGNSRNACLRERERKRAYVPGPFREAKCAPACRCGRGTGNPSTAHAPPSFPGSPFN